MANLILALKTGTGENASADPGALINGHRAAALGAAWGTQPPGWPQPASSPGNNNGWSFSPGSGGGAAWGTSTTAWSGTPPNGAGNATGAWGSAAPSGWASPGRTAGGWNV